MFDVIDSIAGVAAVSVGAVVSDRDRGLQGVPIEVSQQESVVTRCAYPNRGAWCRGLGVSHGPDPIERRSYASLMLGAIEAHAHGAGSPAAAWARSAACELATLYWARGLSTAIVAPQNRRTAALTPLVLSTIARRLARAGEFLAVLDVRDGRLALDEAWQWFIEGGPRRETWRYRVTESGPSNTETRNLPADEVCHVRYAWDAAQPWRGASPAAFAANGAGLAGGIDATLSGEANGPSGSVMVAADLGGDSDDDDAGPVYEHARGPGRAPGRADRGPDAQRRARPRPRRGAEV